METFENWKFAVDYQQPIEQDSSSLNSSSVESNSISNTPTTTTNGGSSIEEASGATFLPAIPTKPATPAFLNDYPEWVKAREEVDNNLNNITAWDNLIKLTENFLLIKPLNENLQTIIRQTFDELLARFPLFFGYWKKYVSVQYQLGGLESSILVLSRSLDAFPNSLELWLDYVSVYVTNVGSQNEDNVERIRVLFEAGLQKVGYQFLSHPFWDKYIDFESNLKTHANLYEKNKKLLNIYVRAIGVPLHQYSKYIKDFNKLKLNFSANQLVEIDPELLKHVGDKKKDSTELKQIVDGYYNKVFTKTAADVAARWKYESKFKPSYFNLVTLQTESLQNFEEYLDFEEKHGTKQQIISLYERILVPAAFYEKFWLKYIKWITANHPQDQLAIKTIYQRAINTFLPLSKNQLRLSYLYYLEALNENEELNNFYLAYLRMFQDNLELQLQVFKKYLGFLKRYQGFQVYVEDSEAVLTKYLKIKYKSGSKDSLSNPVFVKLYNSLNDSLAAVLVTDYIKSLWLVKLEKPSIVRNLFSSFGEHNVLKSSTEFWINYFGFEKLNQNFTLLKKLIYTIKTTTYLPPQIINDLVILYNEYLESNANLISKSDPPITDVYKEIFKNKIDIQSPIAFQTSHKLRLSSDTKKSFRSEESINNYLAKSNGNIGFEIEDRPLIVNQLPLYENLSSVPNLPTFKNVEKANANITYSLSTESS